MTRAVTGQATTAAPAVPVDWRFAHPNADLLIHVNVRALMESDLVREISAELRRAGLAGLDKTRIDGLLALLRDVDSIAVSARARPGAGQPDGLILLSGRLENSPLLGLFQQKSGAPAPRWVSPTTVLLGEGRDGEEAFARLRDAGSPIPGELTSRARRMAPGYDVWMSGRAAMWERAFEALPKSGASLGGIDRVTAGVMVRNPPVLLLTFSAARPEGLKSLLARYGELEQKLRSTPQGRLQWEQLSRLIAVEQEGNELRFRLTGPPEKMAMDLSAFRQMLSAQRGRPRPAEAPARQTILIHGLDGGTREIPFPR